MYYSIGTMHTESHVRTLRRRIYTGEVPVDSIWSGLHELHLAIASAFELQGLLQCEEVVDRGPLNMLGRALPVRAQGL